MKAYIANYSTRSDLECDRDDNPAHDMDLTDHATPQFAVAGAFIDTVIADTRQAVEDELIDLFDMSNEGHELSPFAWVAHGWEETVAGRRRYVLEASTMTDGHVATIVVHEIEFK